MGRTKMPTTDILGRDIHEGDLVCVKGRDLNIGVVTKSSVMTLKGSRWGKVYLIANPTPEEKIIAEAINQKRRKIKRSYKYIRNSQLLRGRMYATSQKKSIYLGLCDIEVHATDIYNLDYITRKHKVSTALDLKHFIVQNIEHKEDHILIIVDTPLEIDIHKFTSKEPKKYLKRADISFNVFSGEENENKTIIVIDRMEACKEKYERYICIKPCI